MAYNTRSQRRNPYRTCRANLWSSSHSSPLKKRPNSSQSLTHRRNVNKSQPVTSSKSRRREKIPTKSVSKRKLHSLKQATSNVSVEQTLFSPIINISSPCPNFVTRSPSPQRRLRSSLRLTDKSSTVIFIDWDNTLFPTSAYEKDGSFDNENFKMIDSSIVQVLSLASSLGIVAIVSNAARKWLAESLCSCLPQTKASFMANEFMMLSARPQIDDWKNTPMDWKYDTFHRICVKQFGTYKPLNIVSIGDDIYEHDASKKLARELQGSIVKNIWFPSDCSFVNLRWQLTKLRKVLRRLVSTKHDTEIKLH